MLMVLGFAAQIWAASKEVHGNLFQEFFLSRGKLKSAGMGALLPRSRTFHEVSVAAAKREPVSNCKLSLAQMHPPTATHVSWIYTIPSDLFQQTKLARPTL